MFGEPKFSGWNPEVPQTEHQSTEAMPVDSPVEETITKAPEQGMEQQQAFNTSKIKYQNERDKSLLEENDRTLCERLNQGEKFALVFTDYVLDAQGTGGRFDLLRTNLEEEYYYMAGTREDHLFYAVIVLGDGRRMRFPNFEEAVGLSFSQSMVEDHQLGGTKAAKNSEGRLTIKTAEVAKWLKEKFGNQFVGVIEASPEFDDEPNEAENNAISQAAQLVQNDSLSSEGGEHN